MSNEARGVEWKVGLFLLIGLGIVSVMAIKFGKLGQGFEKYNDLHVEFSNASGLLKDAKVYLSGADVGYVQDTPRLMEEKFAVKVTLKIRRKVRIPRGSQFVIGSAGFLGDAFVSINPPTNPNLDDIYKDEEELVGTRLASIGDLTTSGGAAVEELQKRILELKPTIERVNRLLSDENLKNVELVINNFKSTSENLKATSAGLDQLVGSGKGAMESLKTSAEQLDGIMKKVDAVMVKFDGAVTEIRGAVSGLSKLSDTAADTVSEAKTLLSKANKGQGALGLLLSDKETADNLKSFIGNLRQRGVIFYKDKKEPAAKPRRQDVDR